MSPDIGGNIFRCDKHRWLTVGCSCEICNAQKLIRKHNRMEKNNKLVVIE